MEQIRAWIAAHPILDGMLVALVFLVLAGGILVTALLLLRLLRPSNLRRLFSSPGRAMRSLKLLGMEIEFFDSFQLSDRANREGLRNLDTRLQRVESVVWTKVLPRLEDPDGPNLGL